MTQIIAIEGYKIFQSDWSCLGYLYEVGKVHEFQGEIQMEKSGLHFCPRALDCIRYYKPSGLYKYAQVKGSDQILTSGDKCVTNKLEVIKEISYHDFQKLCTGILKTSSCQTTYINGIKQGKYIEYYRNGQIKLQSYYVKNHFHGLAEQWNQLGVRQNYIIYLQGEIVQKLTPHADGSIRISYTIGYKHPLHKHVDTWGMGYDTIFYRMVKENTFTHDDVIRYAEYVLRRF